MCILCDNGALDLLTAELDRLAPGDLAEAVRDAREAAGPGVLDYAEAVLRGDASPRVDAGLYAEVVVARALESGVLSSAEAFDWGERLKTAAGQQDARVQAFVSACAEIVDDYRFLILERRQVIERFVEAPADAVRFGGLGQDGEIWLEYRGESYAALTQDEAMEVVEREVGANLHSLEPELLLRYTTLPDAGLDVINGVLAKPTDTANEILMGMIDVGLLAEDRVRATGFSPYFGEPDSPAEDLRFGEWVIVRAASR